MTAARALSCETTKKHKWGLCGGSYVYLKLANPDRAEEEPARARPSSSGQRCCCSHINSHNQVRGHRTGSSHSGAEEYPREKHEQKQGCTRTYHGWRNPCLHQKHKIVKSIVRTAISILVHTSHYSRLEKTTIYTACHPRKTTTNILHVVSITTHTHDRRMLIRKRIKQRK